jgi:hypothetical protein
MSVSITKIACSEDHGCQFIVPTSALIGTAFSIRESGDARFETTFPDRCCPDRHVQECLATLLSLPEFKQSDYVALTHLLNRVGRDKEGEFLSSVFETGRIDLFRALCVVLRQISIY